MTFMKLFKPASIILFGGLGLSACDNSSNDVVSGDVVPGDTGGGTTIVAKGSITSFGSIFVNGVE